MANELLREIRDQLLRAIELEDHAIRVLQKLDRARRNHRQLVNITDAGELRRLGLAVEHDWKLLDDAADELRRALNIEGELT